MQIKCCSQEQRTHDHFARLLPTPMSLFFSDFFVGYFITGIVVFLWTVLIGYFHFFTKSVTPLVRTPRSTCLCRLL